MLPYQPTGKGLTMASIDSSAVPNLILEFLRQPSVQHGFTKEQASEAIQLLLRTEAIQEMGIGSIERMRTRAYADLMLLATIGI